MTGNRHLFAIALFTLAACNENSDYKLIRTQGQMKMVSVSTSFVENSENYAAIVSAECPSGKFCKILFFENVSSVSFPLSDSDLGAQVASYSRNPSSGLDELMYACSLGIADSQNCFSNEL